MKHDKDVATTLVPEDRKEEVFQSVADQSEHVFALEGDVAKHLSAALCRFASQHRRTMGRRGKNLPHPQVFNGDPHTPVAERPDAIGLWLLRSIEHMPAQVIEWATQSLGAQLRDIPLARKAVRGAIESSCAHLLNLMPDSK